MHRFEQGGCCLKRHHRVLPALFPTKADKILSKYRPIAPKPSVPYPEKDLASCLNVAVDSSKKTSELVSGSKQNRARKRSTASSFLSGASKRSCTRSRLDRTLNSVQAVLLPALKPREDFVYSETEARSRYGTASKVFYPGLNSQSPSSAQMGSKGMAEKSTGSIERAAEKISLGMRAIIDYSDIAATNIPLRSRGCGGVLAETVDDVLNTGAFGGEDCLRCSRLPPFLAASSCHGFAEEEIRSDENSLSTSKELVTLPLLPYQPLRSNCASELSLQSNNGGYEDRDSDASYLTELRLCGGIESSLGKEDACLSVTDRYVNIMPAMAVQNGSRNKIDAAFLDQTYMASRDAVMLMGEADRVLWSNAAFKKAMEERLIDHSPQPYVDILGFPIFLAYHVFQPFPGAPLCKGILWGFLKKLVFQPRDTSQQHDSSGCSSTLPSPLLNGLDRSSGLKPIAPQAVRPVGSTINLECITEVWQVSVPTTIRKLEHAKEQLEQVPMPAVVVDALSRVRYVNTAYKKLFGQPECPSWQATAISDTSASASQSWLAGKVSLVCVNDQPPLTAAAFSCRVSIHWSNAAASKSVTVPCDVCKLVDGDDESVYAWRFHITAADLHVKNLEGSLVKL